MEKRHTDIDLHTNSFTCCILQEGREEIMQTWSLRYGDISRFIATPGEDDEVAVEATGNSAWFRKRIETNVARVIVVAPSLFEVIRHRQGRRTETTRGRPLFSCPGTCCRRPIKRTKSTHGI